MDAGNWFAEAEPARTMVYRGSLQTDDPRDAPKLVRMSPLRTSRPNNPVSNSRAASSVNSPIYHGPFVPAIDVHRAKLIDERRLARERDIAESMQKVIMRTTGVKVGAPRLRNISQIRDTVFVDPALIPMEKIGRTEKDRPRTIAIDGSSRSARTQSSMLADLKDLERLRNTPPAQRCPRVATKNETKSSLSNKKTELSSSAKIRSDIFKIQQMFQTPDGSPRTGVKCSNEKKFEKRHEMEKLERKAGAEINKTRLLAQKLLEASRSNRESLKDRYNNPRNASNLRAGKEVNGRVSSKVSQKNNVDSKQPEKGKNLTVSEEVHPRPPVRRRKESKNRRSSDTHVNATAADNTVTNDIVPEDSKNITTTEKETEASSNDDDRSNVASATGDSKIKAKELDRPDILDGLLKESDQQLADLKLDLHERRRSRSHWRGFVQSMRLHDVELHSDSEDQRKGERVDVCSHCRLAITSGIRVAKVYRC